jgi:hypothetical protein
MTLVIAAKTLARVETVRKKSNQHELNAGRLRKQLQVRQDVFSGNIVFYFFAANSDEPLCAHSRFKIYNAREGQPRAPEYRLYYTSTRFGEQARPGDLIVLMRSGTSSSNLKAVVARRGSELERELSRLLRTGPKSALTELLRLKVSKRFS